MAKNKRVLRCLEYLCKTCNKTVIGDSSKWADHRAKCEKAKKMKTKESEEKIKSKAESEAKVKEAKELKEAKEKEARIGKDRKREKNAKGKAAQQMSSNVRKQKIEQEEAEYRWYHDNGEKSFDKKEANSDESFADAACHA